MARILSGLASLLGRLASFFRLGTSGFAEEGTQQPARSHLRTVPEIISELRAEQVLPSAAEGVRWSWSYICYWYDVDTGERVGRGVAWTVETPAGTDYRTAAAEARRRTLYPSDIALSPPLPTAANVKLTCRRIGQPIVIPTQ